MSDHLKHIPADCVGSRGVPDDWKQDSRENTNLVNDDEPIREKTLACTSWEGTESLLIPVVFRIITSIMMNCFGSHVSIICNSIKILSVLAL